MLNCREATHLSSEAEDRQLTFRETISLRMHLVMCKLCRRYARQLRFLRLVAAQLAARPQTESGLSQTARERIRREVERTSPDM
jgi:hypothetical protein